MSEVPIVEIRAVNYRWMIPSEEGHPIDVEGHRLEVRRQGETEWVQIPVIEIQAAPDD